MASNPNFYPPNYAASTAASAGTVSTIDASLSDLQAQIRQLSSTNSQTRRAAGISLLTTQQQNPNIRLLSGRMPLYSVGSGSVSPSISSLGSSYSSPSPSPSPSPGPSPSPSPSPGPSPSPSPSPVSTPGVLVATNSLFTSTQLVGAVSGNGTLIDSNTNLILLAYLSSPASFNLQPAILGNNDVVTYYTSRQTSELVRDIVVTPISPASGSTPAIAIVSYYLPNSSVIVNRLVSVSTSGIIFISQTNISGVTPPSTGPAFRCKFNPAKNKFYILTLNAALIYSVSATSIALLQQYTHLTAGALLAIGTIVINSLYDVYMSGIIGQSGGTTRVVAGYTCVLSGTNDALLYNTNDNDGGTAAGIGNVKFFPALIFNGSGSQSNNAGFQIINMNGYLFTGRDDTGNLTWRFSDPTDGFVSAGYIGNINDSSGAGQTTPFYTVSAPGGNNFYPNGLGGASTSPSIDSFWSIQVGSKIVITYSNGSYTTGNQAQDGTISVSNPGNLLGLATPTPTPCEFGAIDSNKACLILNGVVAVVYI